jgi:hypothetical protein
MSVRQTLGYDGLRAGRRYEEQVKRLIAEFEASGLGRREFRGRHGLALSMLQWHLSLFQAALGFIFGSLFERNNFPSQAHPFFWHLE